MLPLIRLNQASRAIEKSRRILFSFMLNDEQSTAFLEADNEGRGAAFIRAELSQYDADFREELEWFMEFSEYFTNLTVSRVRNVMLAEPTDIETYTDALEDGLGDELTYLRVQAKSEQDIYLTQAVRSAEKEAELLLPAAERIAAIAERSPRGDTGVDVLIPEFADKLRVMAFDYLLAEVGKRMDWTKDSVSIRMDEREKQSLKAAIGEHLQLDIRASMDIPIEERRAFGRDPVALFLFLVELEEVYGYLFVVLLLEDLPIEQLGGPRFHLALSGISEKVLKAGIYYAGAVNVAIALQEIGMAKFPETHGNMAYAPLVNLAAARFAGWDSENAVAALVKAAQLRQGQSAENLVDEQVLAIKGWCASLLYEQALDGLRVLTEDGRLKSYGFPYQVVVLEKESLLLRKSVDFLVSRGQLSEEKARAMKGRLNLSSEDYDQGEDLLDRLDSL